MDMAGAFWLFTVLLASTLYLETTTLAEAKSFLVGGLIGWSKENNGSWFPIGTIFYAGDSLEFVYNQTDYNVIALDKHAYETCRAPEGAFEYNSGDDKVYVNKGENYFICTKRGCCENNMKMMIVAAAGQRQTERQGTVQVGSGQDNQEREETGGVRSGQVKSWVLIGTCCMLLFLLII